MSTFDQVIIDDRDLVNRYFGDINLDDDEYRLSNFSTNSRRTLGTRVNSTKDFLTNNNDNTGLLGRRVFLESPSFDNKDEEEIYRFVPSRLSDHPVSLPAPTAETLIDSLDFELNGFGAALEARPLTYRSHPQFLQSSKPPPPLTQISNPSLQPIGNSLPQTNPRQDPLLGPLLAELDAISTQQQHQNQPTVVPSFRRNSVPYEPSQIRGTSNYSQLNHTLANTANRTVTDALLEAELFDSLETRDTRLPSLQPRQPLPLSAPNLNSTTHSQQQQKPSLPPRTSNMNSTDIFYPTSYDTGPGSFLSNFHHEDQLFQQPLLSAAEQNYASNTRPQVPSQQQKQTYDPRDTTFDNSFSRVSPPQRNTYPVSRLNDNFQRQPQPPPPPVNNRQAPYNNMDPFTEYRDMYAPSNQRLPPVQTQQPGPSSTGTYPQQPHQRSGQQQQQQYNDTPKAPPSYPSTNRELFFTDHDDDQLDQISYRQQQALEPTGNDSHRNDEHHDQDSRRQAIWNELQRNNVKVQEKNAKKRESANRREQLLKGNYTGAQQSSAPVKPNGNPPAQRRPPPVPVAKTNYIDDNIDMIKNKENFYHRYPAKKYENLYSKRKDLAGGGRNAKKENDADEEMTSDFNQGQSSAYGAPKDTDANSVNSKHRSSLPVTINLNPGRTSQTGPLPATVTIPLDSHVNRVGDKISVNIDLRLVDLQNLQKQQATEHPDWSGLDPLDRHIRKLEQSIDQSLPQTNSPIQRNAPVPNPAIGTSIGRYGKLTTGAAQTGYSPPSYGSDYYSYSDKAQNEDSYLAKMSQMKRTSNFKPYNGRDYEEFKKNHGYGSGYLGFDFNNPNYKEKSDKLSKTKEYAQIIEARNKKKLAEAPRRTLSDTRIPADASKTQRALEYARVSTRQKQSSNTPVRSTPTEPNEMKGNSEPGYRPPVAQKINKSSSNDNNGLVERLAMRHEQEKAQVQGILNPSQKRREPLFNNDQSTSDIERLAQDRAQQRRISPTKPFPPVGSNTTTNGRRPLRFDIPVAPDDSAYPPTHHTQSDSYSQHGPASSSIESSPRRGPDRVPNRPPPPQDNIDELANRHNDEKMLMEAIRQELSERPLGEDEELIVIEQ